MIELYRKQWFIEILEKIAHQASPTPFDAIPIDWDEYLWNMTNYDALKYEMTLYIYGHGLLNLVLQRDGIRHVAWYFDLLDMAGRWLVLEKENGNENHG